MNSMAYQKQTWNDNDVITKAKLDYIEDGIVQAEKVPTVPDANTSTKGIVKQATKIDAIGMADAPAADEAYTKANIQKIVDLVNKDKEIINNILEVLKTAGIMANA